MAVFPKTLFVFDQMKTQTSEASSLSHPKNSMGNETREENKSKGAKERLNKDKRKEVIISVYVESPSPHSSNAHRKGGGDRHNEAKKSNNKSRPLFISKIPQAAKTRGYDRHAQLLAYARELRQNPDTKQPEWPKTNSKPKPKANIVSSLELKAGPKQMMSMRKLSNPVRIEFAKSRKKYHRLVPEVDISCQPKSIILRNKKNVKNKKKANRHTDFRFVGKLRGIMTGFCKE